MPKRLGKNDPSIHHKEWSSIQEAQVKLPKQLYTLLKYPHAPFESFTPETLMPYLFSTAGLFTPSSPIFWGELILEWKTYVPDVSEIAEELLAPHPHKSMILSRKDFLPNESVKLPNKMELPPRLPPPKEMKACDFQTYVIHRTIKSIELLLGGPSFPPEVFSELSTLFSKYETVRMDVSFAMSFPKKLLTEEFVYGGVVNETLEKFRCLLNLMHGHIPKELRKNPALQTIYLWVFHSKDANIGWLSRAEYTFTMTELNKKVPSPMERPLNPVVLVERVNSLRPIYSKERDHTNNAFALLSIAITHDRIASIFEFILKCHQSPYVTVTTKHVLDYATEKGHLETLVDDEVFFDYVLSLLPENLSGPSEELFNIFIKPYSNTVEERKKQVQLFIDCMKSKSTDPIDSHLYFRALHRELTGKLPLGTYQMIKAFEQEFQIALSTSDKLFFANQPLQALPDSIDLTDSLKRVYSEILKLPYTFETKHLLHLAYEFVRKKESLQANWPIVQDLEAFLGATLIPEHAYILLSSHLSEQNIAVNHLMENALPQEENLHSIILKLGKLREQILTRHLDDIVIDSELITSIIDCAAGLAKYGVSNSEDVQSCGALIQFLMYSALLYPYSLHHTRCFPTGISETSQLEFPSPSLQHTFLPLWDIDTHKSCYSYWEKSVECYTYSFSIVHLGNLRTYSGTAKLFLTPDQLRKEPELMELLKELCWRIFAEIEVCEGLKSVQNAKTFEYLLAAFPSAAKRWETFSPHALDKNEVIAPALFIFFNELRISSRQAILHLATQGHSYIPSSSAYCLQEEAVKMHVYPTEFKNKTTFSIVPAGCFKQDDPLFCCYTTVEDVAPLVTLITEQVIGMNKTLIYQPTDCCLTLTMNDQSPLYPPPEVHLSCHQQDISYVDQKFNKMHEAEVSFSLTGYAFSLQINYQSKVIETFLTLDRSEIDHQERLVQWMQYLIARLKSEFYKQFIIQKKLDLYFSSGGEENE